MSAANTPPFVHVWCIINPVGGGGKARRQAKPLLRRLQSVFPSLPVELDADGEAVIRQTATDSDLLQYFAADGCSKSDEQKGSPDAVDEPKKRWSMRRSKPALPASPSKASVAAMDNPAVLRDRSYFLRNRCGVFFSRSSGDSLRLARDLVSREVLAAVDALSDSVQDTKSVAHGDGPPRTPGQPHSGVSTYTSMVRTFVVAVGGDGTLGEIINGLCLGVLFGELSGSGCIVPVGRGSTSADCPASGSLTSSSPTPHRMACFPNVVYCAAGTGHDFSRLGRCCLTSAEALAVIEAGAPQTASAPQVALDVCVTEVEGTLHLSNECDSDGDSPTVEADKDPVMPSDDEVADAQVNKAQRSGRFGSGWNWKSRRRQRQLDPEAAPGIPILCPIDIGSITFLRTGTRRFFINECSTGISYAVVNAAERMKKKRYISFLGAKGVFLFASANAVLKLKTRSFRIRQLLHHVADSGEADDAVSTAEPRQGPDAEQCSPAVAAGENPPGIDGADGVWFKQRRLRGLRKRLGTHGADRPPSAGEDEAGMPEETPLSRATQHEHWKKGEWVQLKSSALVFCNGQYFGGGMRIAPTADPSSGTLSIVSWGAGSSRLASGLISIYNGNASLRWRTSRIFEGQCLLVDTAKDVKAEKKGRRWFTQRPRGARPESATSSVMGSAASPERSPNCETAADPHQGQSPCAREMVPAVSVPDAYLEADGEPLEPLPALIETRFQIPFVWWEALPVMGAQKRSAKK